MFSPHKEIFISYGRKDSLSFAHYLQQRLCDRGYSVWFDFESIPGGVDYQKKIDDGIEKADNFVFIISPHATNSPYCRKEIERAIALKKRIIPIMHVEAISRATWQQRHPQGTDTDWAAYQATGAHSCFTHMHPEIAKINWNQVTFPGGEQDFNEAAFEALIEIVQRENLYVHQHTQLLTAALAWQRHQEQSQYLLIGQARQQAEMWLAVRFKDELPPCQPTDLHYEFITESIKNANNLMTQVFIAHAEEDRAIAETVRRTLMRAGITTWVNYDDIAYDTNLDDAMTRGVEEADNVVFVMSPHSLLSISCRQHIDLAVSLHKRIIILYAGHVRDDQIPPALAPLPRIDLTDNESDADYLKDESDLLRTLQHEATYHTEHKVLLTKALKWERQQHNPCILLQGYELEHAIHWLKVAQQSPIYGPTPLQVEFIQASQRQPSGIARDVFISYSRTDSGFARKLNDALQRHGKRTWFDQESIASGADFQQEIYKGIEVSHHFLFVISPASIRSAYCAAEVGYAASLHKRIVTVRHCPVEAADLDQHPDLANVQWVDFYASGNEFTVPFQELLRTLETDPEHLHAHTRYLQRAIEWHQGDRKESLLMRGDDLEQAETWLTQSEGKDPQPTALQREFIHNSRTVEDANQQAVEILRKAARGAKRLVAGAVLLGGLAAGGAAWYAQARIAQANVQVRNAELRAQMIEIDNLLTANRNDKALWTALQLGHDLSNLSDSDRQHLDQSIQTQLTAALHEIYFREGFVLHTTLPGHGGWVNRVQFSPNGSVVASIGADGIVKLRDPQTGQEFAFDAPINHGSALYGMSFSPDGLLMATAGLDGTIKLWDMTTGQLRQTFVAIGREIHSLDFSPSGNLLASGGVDRTVTLWNVQTGQVLKTLAGHQDSVNRVRFSPDGATLASSSTDKTVKLWDVSSGQVRFTLAGHTNAVNGIDFSPDGKTLVSASTDDTLKLWDVSSGQALRTFREHPTSVSEVVFSPDGTTLASASNDNTVKLWNISTGEVVQTLSSHENWVYALSFSPDGQALVSAGQDDTVKIWKFRSGRERYTLMAHGEGVIGVDFAANGSFVASSGGDSLIRLWEGESGDLVRVFQGHNSGVTCLQFSPDDSFLVSGSHDRTVKVWDVATGELRHTLTGHSHSTLTVAISPSGADIASGGHDGILRLWNANTGQLIRTYQGRNNSIYSLAFAPDGKTLVSADYGGIIQFWDFQTGENLLTIEDGGGAVNRIKFSPDGSVLASVSTDGTIKIRDALTGADLQTIQGHTAVARDVSFSPDGKLLASASDDQTVKLWDVQTGQELQTLRGHDNWVLGIDFAQLDTPNSEPEYWLVSGSEDGTVKFWTFNPEAIDDLDNLENLMRKTCAWQQDYLTYGLATDGQRAVCQ